MSDAELVDAIDKKLLNVIAKATVLKCVSVRTGISTVASRKRKQFAH